MCSAIANLCGIDLILCLKITLREEGKEKKITKLCEIFPLHEQTNGKSKCMNMQAHEQMCR